MADETAKLKLMEGSPDFQAVLSGEAPEARSRLLKRYVLRNPEKVRDLLPYYTELPVKAQAKLYAQREMEVGAEVFRGHVMGNRELRRELILAYFFDLRLEADVPQVVSFLDAEDVLWGHERLAKAFATSADRSSEYDRAIARNILRLVRHCGEKKRESAEEIAMKYFDGVMKHLDHPRSPYRERGLILTYVLLGGPSGTISVREFSEYRHFEDLVQATIPAAIEEDSGGLSAESSESEAELPLSLGECVDLLEGKEFQSLGPNRQARVWESFSNLIPYESKRSLQMFAGRVLSQLGSHDLDSRICEEIIRGLVAHGQLADLVLSKALDANYSLRGRLAFLRGLDVALASMGHLDVQALGKRLERLGPKEGSTAPYANALFRLRLRVRARLAASYGQAPN